MVGLVADDLTGACDSAAPFLRCGRVVVALWPPRLKASAGLACLALSTDSRSEDPTLSCQRAREAAGWLATQGADLLYRKVDSVFRGNQVADLAGTLDAWEGTCVLAPALPEEQRVTRNGVQRWPGGEVDLEALFSDLGDRVLIRDAETTADLDQAAAEILATPGLIPAGTAGLATALAWALTAAPAGFIAPLPPVRQPLALIGSTAALPQAEYAEARGWSVRRRLKTDPVDIGAHDGLLLCGGSTAGGVLRALSALGLELVGQLAPRVPSGRILGGPYDGLPVALKSGHFGPVEVIDTALRSFTAIG